MMVSSVVFGQMIKGRVGANCTGPFGCDVPWYAIGDRKADTEEPKD